MAHRTQTSRPAPTLPPLPQNATWAPPAAWHPYHRRPVADELTLYSFQSPEVAERLRAGEAYRTARQRSSLGRDETGQVTACYAWITQRLAELVPAPSGCELPVWAWYVGDPRRGPARPDLRGSMHRSSADKVMVTFRAPAQQVLLSDFKLWSYGPYSAQACTTRAEDRALERFASAHGIDLMDAVTGLDARPEAAALRAWAEASWARTTDPSWTAPRWLRQASDRLTVQACLWEIRPEQVLDMRPYKARVKVGRSPLG